MGYVVDVSCRSKEFSIAPYSPLVLQDSNNRFWYVLPTHKATEDAEKPGGTY